MSELLTDEQLRAINPQDARFSLVPELLALRARVASLEVALTRCQTVLGNMALENEGAVFNRWRMIEAALKDTPQ